MWNYFFLLVSFPQFFAESLAEVVSHNWRADYFIHSQFQLKKKKENMVCLLLEKYKIINK